VPYTYLYTGLLGLSVDATGLFGVTLALGERKLLTVSEYVVDGTDVKTFLVCGNFAFSRSSCRLFVGFFFRTIGLLDSLISSSTFYFL
jgi:hypothetical protein